MNETLELDSSGFLHHIEIYVSDLAKSSDFWGSFLDLLGYTIYQRWDKGISYLKEPTYIVLVQVESRFLQPAYHRRRVGLNHIAFHASSKKQVDSMTRFVEEYGLTVLYKNRHPHAGGPESYSLFFEDPDRIKIELVAPNDGGLSEIQNK